MHYSPVRHWCCHPFDLHVLSTPPAFVLSQDQTLMFKAFDSFLPCGRKAQIFLFSGSSRNRWKYVFFIVLDGLCLPGAFPAESSG